MIPSDDVESSSLESLTRPLCANSKESHASALMRSCENVGGEYFPEFLKIIEKGRDIEVAESLH
jgi:hypothetical protein